MIAAIREQAEFNRSWGRLCVVDVGETDCLVARPHPEATGLRPEGQRT